MNIKITRKLLDDYRKIKREIPLLETELKEMRETDSGIGNSTIILVVVITIELQQVDKNVLSNQKA